MVSSAASTVHRARDNLSRYTIYLAVFKGKYLPTKSTDEIATKPWIALFDLDGTLTWRDTLLPFLLGFVRQRPYRVLKFWRLPLALVRYWQDRDRGALKSRVIRMLMRGEKRSVLETWAQNFVAQLKPKHQFRPVALAVLEAHRAAGDHLVLL